MVESPHHGLYYTYSLLSYGSCVLVWSLYFWEIWNTNTIFERPHSALQVATAFKMSRDVREKNFSATEYTLLCYERVDGRTLFTCGMHHCSHLFPANSPFINRYNDIVPFTACFNRKSYDGASCICFDDNKFSMRDGWVQKRSYWLFRSIACKWCITIWFVRLSSHGSMVQSVQFMT